MITTELQRDWLHHHLQAGAHQASGPDWLDRLRVQAGRAMDELPLLDRKTEEWRYTSIENLLKQQFTPSSEAPELSQALRETLQQHLIDGLDAYRIVLVNGHYVAGLSDNQPLPSGVTLGSVRELLSSDPAVLASWFGQAVPHTRDVFTALNTALMNDGVFVHVAGNIRLERPIEVIYLATEKQHSLSLQPRNLVVIEAGASATLIERFVGDDSTAPYFHNQLSEIIVGANATLEHYRMQQESPQAYHLSNIYISQRSHSRYHGTTLAYGGSWNRTEYHTSFTEEYAECYLNGLSLVGELQLSDFHLNVLHKVPECISRERFRSVLHGKGRAVFDGYVCVDKLAQHSDAQMSSDNLMLSREGEVDTRPQLEIYADDVKCSHGTTVGELDPQQFFYLRSRGIDESTARSMLCLGFADDIINSVQPLPLQRHAAEQFEHTLLHSKAVSEVVS